MPEQPTRTAPATAPTGGTAAMLERLRERVNGNAALIHRGRQVHLTFALAIGDDEFLVSIAAGRVATVAPRRLATDTGVFSIRAGREAWTEHWRAVPKRDYHDIWSMLPKGLARLDGDLLPLMQNLQYFKDVLASPRAQES